MAKKHGRKTHSINDDGSVHGVKGFDIEDVRRLFVLQQLSITISKKLHDIVASDDKNTNKRYKEALSATKAYLTALDKIKPTKSERGSDCWDDYEDCGGGVCRPWCS